MRGKILHFYRQTRALMYKYVYGNPSVGMKVIGITGTEGKTTTVEMVYAMLVASVVPAGVISTIGAKINGEMQDTGLHTTQLKSKDTYRLLLQMKKQSVRYAVLELTSQGLAQQRAYGISLAGAIITNITRDHLDYHKTFEEYRKAKAKIIDMITDNGFLLLNGDDPNTEYFISYAKARNQSLHIIMFSSTDKSLDTLPHYYYSHLVATNEGIEMEIHLSNSAFPIKIPFPGEYNAMNALAAIGMCVSLSLPLKGIIEGIQSFSSVSGRMDIVQKEPFTVIVDFAHTPNAFEQILSHIRKTNPLNRIIVLFGCPGKRDKGKRPMMGKSASDYADVIVITSDDPREEDFSTITKDIEQGIDMDKFVKDVTYFVIQDREEAIKYTETSLAKQGDIILLLGKGHEESIAIGNNELPWNDRKIALQYLHG